MSGVNIIPSNPELAEAILPELAPEVWDIILKSLADPTDIINANNTCTLFQKLLRTKILTSYFSKTLLFLTNYIGMWGRSTFLNCRLVSKGWRDGVDNFFETYFLNKTHTGHIQTERLRSFYVTKRSGALYPFGNQLRLYENWNIGDQGRFVSEMREHTRNPFIGRAIHYRLDHDEENSRYNFRTLCRFLEIFGKHVWTIHLEIKRCRDDYAFSFILRDVFDLVPNLKRLIIVADDIPFSNRMTLNEINLLPPPAALKRLEIFRLHPTLQNAILQRVSNTQLKTLSIEGVEPLREMLWPNLKELHLLSVCNERQLDALAHLSAPQLELLALKYSSENGWDIGVRPSLRNLLTVLQKLARTSPNLAKIRFHDNWLWRSDLGDADGPDDADNSVYSYDYSNNSDDSDNSNDSDDPAHDPDDWNELQGPESIKTLELQDKCDVVKLNGVIQIITRRFPHVQNIRISKSGSVHFEPANRRNTFQFMLPRRKKSVEVYKYMYTDKMYESNIWELNFSLKVFSFGKTVYTRKIYEEKRQENRRSRRFSGGANGQ